MERLMTYKEAAARLGVSTLTVRRMIEAGRLTAIYITPRTPRIREAQLMQVIEGRA